MAEVADIVRAIRILAEEAEDEKISLHGASCLFASMAGHHSPAVRIAAVEAIWQLAYAPAGKYLRALAAQESNETVKKTMEHVAGLFKA